MMEEVKKLTVLDWKESNNEGIGHMESLMRDAEKIDARSEDLIIRRADLSIKSEGPNLNLFHNKDYTFGNWALGQLCEHSDIPARYIKKCLDAGEAQFAAENINKWIGRGDPNKEFLLRATDSQIHGFLSTRYGIFDDHDVLKVLNVVLPEHGKYTVKNQFLSPELMNIRIVQDQKLDIDGEDLSLALNIRNSRVGQSSLEIQVMIFKWICSNGVIFGGGAGTLLAKRHVSLNRPALISDLHENLSSIPQIAATVKTWVEASKQNKLDSAKMQDIINEMKKDVGISKQAEVKILELIPKYGENVFGFAQAITETAQDFSLDLRSRMEEFAGKIMMAA